MKLVTLLLGLSFIAGMDAQTPKLTHSIPLPGVEGRIDHMSLDVASGRLFVAALGNNTVEVVDLKARKVARSLGGFSEPQGVLFVPEFNRLYVANGGDGAVRVFDGTSYASVATVKFDDDADNVRYDPGARQVYVGYGSGALGIIDPAKDTVVGTIALTAHPESFQLERNGPRIFVNLPRSHTVAVIDRTSRQVAGHWSLGLAAANFPMALDEPHHRAFVGCRAPARLLVFDTQSGREIAKLELHGDCDDVFYDPARDQVYASCGAGFLDVFATAYPDHPALRESVKTIDRARTSFFTGDQIYVAVPREAGTDAQLLVYDLSR